MSRAGGRLGLGPIDQVSYVVKSIEASLDRYEEIYGPFEIMEADLQNCTIRGKQANCRLKIAINRSGPIEVELIEVLEGTTTHSEHLSEHGEGLHHVRFRVSDIEKKVAELEAQGLSTVFYKRFSPEIAFAYIEAPSELGSSVIELLDMP